MDRNDFIEAQNTDAAERVLRRRESGKESTK